MLVGGAFALTFLAVFLPTAGDLDPVISAEASTIEVAGAFIASELWVVAMLGALFAVPYEPPLPDE